MSEITLWEFPVPSTGVGGVGISLVLDGDEALLCFNYDDDYDDYKPKNGGLRFRSVQAFSQRSEYFLDGIRGYDRLVEVTGSEWASEFARRHQDDPSFRAIGMPKHYAIFLDSYGQLDFLAHSYEVMEARDGFVEVIC